LATVIATTKYTTTLAGGPCGKQQLPLAASTLVETACGLIVAIAVVSRLLERLWQGPQARLLAFGGWRAPPLLLLPLHAGFRRIFALILTAATWLSGQTCNSA
jgi:hypothetical protein